MTPVDPSFPWAELLGGGAAGVAILMCVIWMKHVKEMRAENTAHVENVTRTVENVAAVFADTTQKNAESVERTAASFEKTILQLHNQTADLVREVLRSRDPQLKEHR